MIISEVRKKLCCYTPCTGDCDNCLLLNKFDELFDEIKADIAQVAFEEAKHDSRWALGLSYAKHIIDKHIKDDRL